MRLYKLSLKEDMSKRVSSPGKEKKNYQPKKVKMASMREGKNPTTMLGKGNMNKPSGALPYKVNQANVNSPRNNPYYGGYGNKKMPSGKTTYKMGNEVAKSKTWMRTTKTMNS